MTRTLVFYAILLGVFAIAVTAILHAGVSLGVSGTAPAADHRAWELLSEAVHTPVSQLLIQVLVIVTLARACGALFERVGQPPVVGEMFAGIALGPSLLGAVSPAVSEFIFPASSLSHLFLLSQVGILLFMFIVGMELDTKLLRQRAHSAILISHASIIVPFLMGTTSALWLFREYSGSAQSFQAFALFMGISMSITAFPVLARILDERHLSFTRIGTTAITCAAVDDVSAWCALAFITAVSRAQGFVRAASTVALSIAFVALVLGVVRPLIQRVARRSGDTSHPRKTTIVIALATAFACALCTEAIGIHALFGAFLAGIAMPPFAEFRRFLRERIEYFSTLFLLPVFFVFTGLRTQIGLLHGRHDWAICGLLLAIAVAGKFGGSSVAAKLTGHNWKESAAIGTLMNTRGLVELIALNLGLDLNVLSPKIFAMLVLMALLTTVATGPVLSLLRVSGAVAADGTPAIAPRGETSQG